MEVVTSILAFLVILTVLVFVHEYPDRSVRLHAFLARDPDGEPRTDGDQQWLWKDLDEIRQLKMPPANEQVLRALKWRIRPAASR